MTSGHMSTVNRPPSGPVQALAPVGEAEVRAVAGRVEPALVTAEHLAVERRGVDVGARGTGVRPQPRLVGNTVRGRHSARALDDEQREHRRQSNKTGPGKLWKRPASSGGDRALLDSGHG